MILRTSPGEAPQQFETNAVVAHDGVADAKNRHQRGSSISAGDYVRRLIVTQ